MDIKQKIGQLNAQRAQALEQHHAATKMLDAADRVIQSTTAQIKNLRELQADETPAE